MAKKCSVDTCFRSVAAGSHSIAALCSRHFDALPDRVRRGLLMRPVVCRIATGKSRDDLLEEGLVELLGEEAAQVAETTPMGPIPDKF